MLVSKWILQPLTSLAEWLRRGILILHLCVFCRYSPFGNFTLVGFFYIQIFWVAI